MRFTNILGLGALVGLVALNSVSPLWAQDTADPKTTNTTTQKDGEKKDGDAPGSDQIKERLPRDEYEAGWIKLFDGATTYGWEPRGMGAWTLADQSLQATGSGATLATTAEFADFELAGECSLEGQGAATLSLRAPTTGGITSKNAAQVKFMPAGRAAAKSDTYLVPQGKWTPFAVTLQGGKMTHLPDSTGKRVEATVPGARGVIALTSTGRGAVKFRNLRLKPLGYKSLFNGKDLSGWNVIPGYPSMFSVAQGALNIKGGPGDIQSEGVYGDFVLSVDVYSNGDHLNSGVFFRVEPGKYRQGYEDQIRNEWQGDDRAKPVDYGTGAVYNRLPARKVVSSDREWFTLTLVVSGSHIGSYVDGYLVSDFTDKRPPNQENARLGARVKPGAFGLQGHDPTTDVSFRNIRVVELPQRAVEAAGSRQ